MKQELRIRFRALRDAIPGARRRAAAAAIGRHLEALPEYRASDGVLFYASFGSEVPTTGLMRDSAALGKQVALPRMESRDLRIHLWDPAVPLVANRHGVPEPPADGPLMGLSAIDLIIVPGLAFDRRGSRLGYGGGYYDRLLKQAPHAYRVGIGYELQLVPSLPSTHLDVAMDCLVTEEGVHPLPRRKH